MRPVLIASSFLLLASCELGTHTVTYKVTGDENWPKVDGEGPLAHIVISNQNGGSEMHNVLTPYSDQLSVSDGAFVYLSAQAQQGDEIACEIDIDGRPVRQSRSDGQFAIATCSGKV